MKKAFALILKCALALVPFLLIWCFCAFAQMYYADAEYAAYAWNREMTGGEIDYGRDFDVVILGDSSANAAFVPEFLSDGTINLSIGGGAPSENYYILYNYLQNHKAPSVCYMSYTDRHMFQDEAYWDRAAYFHLLPFEQTADIYTRAGYHDDQGLLKDNGKRLLAEYYAGWPALYLPAIINGGFTERYDYNMVTYNDCALHRGAYITRGVFMNSKNDEEEWEHLAIAPLQEEYLEMTIVLCEEHGIIPRFVKLPVSESQQHTDSFINEFNIHYDELKGKYPTLTVDWIKDGYDKYDFSDNLHLNYHGARKLTSDIKAIYPSDFGPVTDDEDHVTAMRDYAAKNQSPDTQIELSAEGKYNNIILIRGSYDKNAECPAHLKASIEEAGVAYESRYLSDGTELIVTDGGDHGVSIAVGSDGESFIIKDRMVGDIIVTRDTTGHFELEFPGDDEDEDAKADGDEDEDDGAVSLTDGSQIDVGIFSYTDAPFPVDDVHYKNCVRQYINMNGTLMFTDLAKK